MPKSTSPATQNVETNVDTEKESSVKNKYENEIDKLKEKNEELSEKLSKLMELMESVKAVKSSDNSSTSKDNTSNVVAETRRAYTYPDAPEEISPNKQVLVMSMCYGPLSLRSNSTGRTALSFTKYGQTLPVLYSTLLDVVNSNRKFAETGKFYILDKSAVYYLGLSEYYKTLFSKDIIDNILTYSPNVIEGILDVANDEQKELIIKLLCKKIYNGAKVDVNKVVNIGKMCDTDIMKKVEEMRTFSNK